MTHPLLAVVALCSALCFGTTNGNKEFYHMVKANNEVALKLYPLICSEKGNFAYSPFGLSTVLKMVHRGAKGETAKEIEEVLGYDDKGLSNEERKTTLKKFLHSQNKGGLVMCNSVLVQKTLGLTPKYQKSMKKIYEAMCAAVDFKHEGPQVVELVNNWVSDVSNGKIPQCLDKLDKKTRVMLLSAVALSAKFEEPFSSSKTKPKTFKEEKSKCKDGKTPMMHQSQKTMFAESDNYKVIELPFKNCNYSLMIYLPKAKDGLPALEKSLTLDTLRKLHKDMKYKRVHIRLPKFKINFMRHMDDDFSKLGAKKVFDDGADLTGMVSKNTKVTHMVHNAVLQVYEKGVKAIATKMDEISRSFKLPKVKVPHLKLRTFYADHPFLFSIVDRGCNMIMFMGRVSECDPEW